MDLGNRVKIVTGAELVALLAFVLDSLAGIDWPDGLVLPLRVIVVLAAAVAAIVCYQTWGAAPERSPLLHAAVGSALLGGASLAASATSASSGEVLGNVALAAIGAAGMTVAAVALRLEVTARARS